MPSRGGIRESHIGQSGLLRVCWRGSARNHCGLLGKGNHAETNGFVWGIPPHNRLVLRTHGCSLADEDWPHQPWMKMECPTRPWWRLAFARATRSTLGQKNDNENSNAFWELIEWDRFPGAAKHDKHF